MPPKKKLWRTPDANMGRGNYSKENMKKRIRKGQPLHINDQVAHPELAFQETQRATSQLPLLLEDSLASLYLMPGSEKARKMTAGSGLKCLESYQKSGPLGLLQKMLLDSSIWGSTIVYLTWRVRAMKRHHFLFQLVPSMPRTEEIESSLWPTMRAVDSDRNSVKSQANYYQKTGHHRNLKAVVGLSMWPTPRQSEYKGVGPLGSKSQEYRLEKGYLDATVQEREQTTGQLNPNWVEWLMGFPPGWTDLNV